MLVFVKCRFILFSEHMEWSLAPKGKDGLVGNLIISHKGTRGYKGKQHL